MRSSLFRLFVAFSFSVAAQAQPAFQNLDFEACSLPQNHPAGLVDSSVALPDWSAFSGSNSLLSQVGFRAWWAGTPVSLFATNGISGTSIDGGFSIFLVGAGVDFPGGPLPFQPAAVISQTGLVPAASQCILLKAHPGSSILRLSLNGQRVPLTKVGAQQDFTVYAGDVGPYAGQSLQLDLAVGFRGTGWIIDSIEFAPAAIPTPATNHLAVERFFDGIRLSVFTETNKYYALLYASDLTATEWSTLGDDVGGTDTTRVWFDAIAPATNRYYRLLIYQ